VASAEGDEKVLDNFGRNPCLKTQAYVDYLGSGHPVVFKVR